MSAYQPISITPAATPDFAGTLTNALQLRQKSESDRASALLGQQRLGLEQQQQDEAKRQHDQAFAREKQRQDVEGRQAVMALMDAGHHSAAAQMAKAYGIDLSSVVTPPTTTQPGAGDALMPPSKETPSAAAPIEGPRISAEDSARSAVLSTANQPDATADDLVAARDKADTSRTDFAAAQSPSTFTEAPATVTPGSTKYKLAGMDYDPQEATRAAQAERARRAEVNRSAFAPLGDKYASTAASASLGDPNVGSLVLKQLEADQKQKETEAEHALQRDLSRENTKLHVDVSRENSRGMQNAIITAAGIKANPNPTPAQDSGTRGDTNAVHRTIKDAAAANGIPKLLQQRDSFNAAMAQLEAQTGLGDADALTSMAKAFRGGVPNMFEDKRLQDHITGVLGRLESIAAGAQNGRLGPEAEANIKKTLESARTEMEKHVDGRFQTFSKGIGSNPALRNYADQVNAEVRTIFAPLGRDVPDVMQSTGETPPALGEAQRRAHQTPENPLPRARNVEQGRHAERAGALKSKGAAKAVDPQAQGALDWIAANPNDPRVGAAKAKLRAQGIDVP